MTVSHLLKSPASRLHQAISAGLYLFFALFLLWPMQQILSTGLRTKAGGFTLRYVGLIFRDPLLVRGLINATVIAVSVTALSLAIALPLALISVRYEFRGKSLSAGLLLAPLILPPFVGAIGIRLVLGRYGPLTMLIGGGEGKGIDWMGQHRLAGIVLIEALHLYPILFLNLQAALANIDPAMAQAAVNLGASRWTVFRRITLPLIRPGLFAGGTLTLIWSFTELGTPLVFDFYNVTPVQVFQQIADVADNPLPYALVIVMLTASTGLYVVGKLLLGRGFDASTSRATTSAQPRQLSGWSGWVALLPFVVVFMLAFLPHLAVVLTSISGAGSWYRTILPARFTLSHYRDALTDDLAATSVFNSMRYAGFATLLAVIIGVAAAVIIVRSRVRTRSLIDALAMLPLAVPGLVLAFGYLAISLWLKRLLGARLPVWLDVQEDPLPILIIAYACRRMPYVVRSVVAGLEQTPRDLELAAANLGAARCAVLRKITLPLIAANLIAGALLAFAFAMLEVSDSLILAQRQAYFPITKAIVELSQRLGDGLYIACALGVWAMTLLALTILAANALLGKKIGAAFRV